MFNKPLIKQNQTVFSNFWNIW